MSITSAKDLVPLYHATVHRTNPPVRWQDLRKVILERRDARRANKALVT